ncbi:unnamed protein product [Durusdinium trenchii]|uniref:Uncharacterized protein n=2 Tax=Durusdinium trenchii TaxID=1381693 RepID=A0ABP0LFN4_9DINO
MRPWTRLFALRRAWGLRGYSVRARPAGSWTTEELQALVRQAAMSGHLEESALKQLHGESPVERAQDLPEVVKTPGTSEGDGELVAEDALEPVESSGSDTSKLLPCDFTDFVSIADLCRSEGLRNFVALGQLADRMVKELAKPDLAQADELLRLASTFATLGVLHPPLFASLTKSLLSLWKDKDSSATASQVARLARACAAQRFRHEELFGRMANLLRTRLSALSSQEALSLLFSHASLRLAPPYGELDEGMWQALEKHAMSEDISPEAALKLCHALFLSRRVDEKSVPQVVELLSSAAEKLQQRPLSLGLHRRVLLLRSAVRYLHREAYKELPKEVHDLFRKAHRMEAPMNVKQPVLFVRKLSHCLTKLKIGHIVMAERGPFTFDLVERDRKVVYECNHFDRFYANSTEKIASASLQERIVKAMGYRVVQVPHWQWNRIKHRRQRMEYIRMSRYYALKDRREWAPRDEELQDVAVNELDYLGEYFFRKEMPNTHWAWFQPRYDASKRIPEGKTAGTV